MNEDNSAPPGARTRPCFPGTSRIARAGAIALGIGIATLAGCVGTVGTEGYIAAGHPVVRAEIVPAEITAYPRVYYRGTYAYLVGGVWYYPTNRGWMIFEEEPVELRRYRQTFRTSPRYVPEREHSYPRERGRRHYTPR